MLCVPDITAPLIADIPATTNGVAVPAVHTIATADATTQTPVTIQFSPLCMFVPRAQTSSPAII